MIGGLLMAMSSASQAAADDSPGFPFSTFKPGTLATYAQNWADLDKTPTPAGKVFKGIDALATPIKVTVVYTGDQRPTAMSDRDFLLEVFRSQKIDPANIDLYAQEYRFEEAGRSYWLPVQTGVAAFFPKELKPGQKVDLYARFAGATGLMAR